MSLPALRFKEFNTQWDTKPLGDVFSIVVGFVGTVSSHYCEEKDGIPFIRTLNVKDGWFSQEDIQYVTPEFHKKNKKSQLFNDDILIARVGANMGMACKVTGLKREANSANVVIIRHNKSNCSDFYAQYLSSPLGQKQIQEKGAGGAQEVLNISVAKTIILPVPSFEEQSKIANFIRAVDEKISLLTQKSDLLAQYKKGVMQKIFSQELRFKDDDGREFPEWEEMQLSSICEIIKGKQLNKEDLTDYDPHPVINGGQEPSGFTHLWNTEENTITISEGGNSCGYINFIKQKFWSGGHCYTLCNIKDTYLKEYLYQALKFNEPRIMRLRVGSGLPNIQKSAISDFVVSIPKSQREQEKISDFLSAIDDKLTHTQNQLAVAKQYKKGLLQQMFV